MAAQVQSAEGSDCRDSNAKSFIDDIGVLSLEGFGSQGSQTSSRNPQDGISSSLPLSSVYLGETVRYEIVVSKHPSVRESSSWKKLISTISSQAVIVPLLSKQGTDSTVISERVERKSETCGPVKESGTASRVGTKNSSVDNPNPTNNGLLCSVLATFVGSTGSVSSSEEKDSSMSRPYFRDDDTFVVPMSSSLQDAPPECCRIRLSVTVWLYTVSVSTSPTSPEVAMEIGSTPLGSDSTTATVPCPTTNGHRSASGQDPVMERANLADGQPCGSLSLESPVRVSSSFRSVQEKTVSCLLRIQGPPELTCRHTAAGLKHLLLLSVSNSTSGQMVIKSLQILSSSTPVHDVSVTTDDGSSVKWEHCHQLISLESPKHRQAFPAILQPGESFCLIYRLHLSSIPSESELSLRANIKWTHAGATSELTTLYRLPRIKIRCPPFIVTVKCDERVEIHKTFYVTYCISNQLHDFMSMRLYFNMDNMYRNLIEQGASGEEFEKVVHLKDSVVCHDPDIAISSCPRGSSVPIQVGFQIHQPGLYELSELMKVNLRYSLPEKPSPPAPPDSRESRTPSTDTSLSLQSPDDHLLASEELWRGRSGSTASLATPVLLQTAEERRRSFASKSYSFGDLGPTVSADSDEVAAHNKNKLIQRSPTVPPPRPQPPRMLSQTERELVRPSNFLKQPFYVYVQDPSTL
ncbi:microtubule-associated protein 11 isoform X2 [Aplysia californica]|uniref:Microtubule-associated protein 11 isoform X2 n=1 Tax=Aplysia californica TaxID=6500 RepID=A0ABM1W4B0_APLCA|nr:microtubule-associated protein 11 isoform X2 [Aplysia californica]